MSIKARKLPSEQSQNRPNQTSARKAITRPSIVSDFWAEMLAECILPQGRRFHDECHRLFVTHNSSYTILTITQKPSWVCPPSSLKANIHSFLVMAFENQDGSARRSLLSNKQLFILGAKAKVSHW
ncbi:hypothetical protein BGY98DRAFT_1095067 [Russula aff. rugulosa BPL654]|nr:hypothetical protein BGY98DRAFT_1095067 [Russula aff. rugulosa BPL654]